MNYIEADLESDLPFAMFLILIRELEEFLAKHSAFNERFPGE